MGLQKVGPHPWDYVFTPVVGERVSIALQDDSLETVTITGFNEDHETTGELRLEVAP
jgi:hypothetical protein